VATTLGKIAGLLCLAVLTGGLAAKVAYGSGPHEQLNPADQKLAYRLILHLRDLPAGWRVEPPSKSNNECGKLPSKPDMIVTGKARSEFSRGQTDIVGSVAGVTRAAKGAKAAYKYLATGLQRCLLTAMTHAGSDASVGAMSFPHIGDQSSA
jgi:hypothetical protein